MKDSYDNKENLDQYLKICEKLITLHFLLSNEGLNFTEERILYIISIINEVIYKCSHYPNIIEAAFSLLIHITYCCKFENEETIKEIMKNLHYNLKFLMKSLINICYLGYKQTCYVFDWIYETIVFITEDKCELDKLDSNYYTKIFPLADFYKDNHNLIHLREPENEKNLCIYCLSIFHTSKKMRIQKSMINIEHLCC